MADWIELEADIANLSNQELHAILRNKLAKKKGYWIAEVDVGVMYKVFDTLEEMAAEIWSEFPSEYAEEFDQDHRLVTSEAPIIESNYARQYYLLPTNEVARRFLEISKQCIALNENCEEDNDEEQTFPVYTKDSPIDPADFMDLD